jgi:hypothetical protein
VDVDLTPMEMECMRCRQTQPMRFYGLCTGCRTELQGLFTRERRNLDVAQYEPKMNVTPNAVAVKED